MGEAAELMMTKHSTGAPVIENGSLVGVLTNFDFLYKDAGTKSLDLTSTSYQSDVKKMLGKLVRNVMTPKPITRTTTDNMQEAASLMLLKRLHHLPILAGDTKEVVGILTPSDVMRHVIAVG